MTLVVFLGLRRRKLDKTCTAFAQCSSNIQDSKKNSNLKTEEGERSLSHYRSNPIPIPIPIKADQAMISIRNDRLATTHSTLPIRLLPEGVKILLPSLIYTRVLAPIFSLTNDSRNLPRTVGQNICRARPAYQIENNFDIRSW